MTYLSAFVLIGVLVAIHEFGHFIVAKWCGVHCTVFSIGYGARLFGFKWKGTDYRLSALPLGGYVRMAGTDIFGTGEASEADEPLDFEQSFMYKPVWQRILIVAAGPAFNLILPLVVFTALLMAGDPQPAPVVGIVNWGSPAQEAGLLPGDRIGSLNGREVNTWTNLLEEVDSLEPGSYPIQLYRDGTSLQKEIRIEEEKRLGVSFWRPNAEIGVDDPKSPAGKAGLTTGDVVTHIDGKEVSDFVDLQRALKGKSRVEVQYIRESANANVSMAIDPFWQPQAPYQMVGLDKRWGMLPSTQFVDDVSDTVEEQGIFSCGSAPLPPSPAMVEGILPGDRFIRIENQEIHAWGDIPAAVKSSMEGEGKEATTTSLHITLIRFGEKMELDVTPRMIQDTDSFGNYRYRPILGIRRGGDFEDGPSTRIYYPFSSAFSLSFDLTKDISKFIVVQIGKLITGEAAVEKSLGGPVEIVRQAKKAAEKGLFEWARLMALMSISLGIINLVPIPILDGGQLLFFIIEGVRGRPVSPRMREYAMQAGVIFMVLLMFFVFVFDISRWLGS